MNLSKEDMDDAFDPPRRFIPIDDAARDGRRQLVRRGSDYAAAQWTGEMWSYPYGHGDDEADFIEQIDFEPTHYAPRTAAEEADSATAEAPSPAAA